MSAVRDWARGLKRDVHALTLAARDPRVPWHAKVLAVLVAAYALSPIDLIPDFVPILGYLDDVILVPIGIWCVLRLVPPSLMAEFRTAAADQSFGRALGRNGAVLIVLLWIGSIVALVAWLPRAPTSVSQIPTEPAAQFITTAFKRHPLVTFSEPGHGVSGTKEFLAALIRHPGFAGTVTDIVIECGTARYQAIADRYFAGQPVAHDELRQIWENTTIVSGIWQLPMYEEILADIRAFNMTLPQHQRIRVLLGDPPIDWTVVRSPADEDMNDWRDAHFAWVVTEQVMKKGRKALLWIGGGHTSRKVIFPDTVIHLLDRRFPGQTLVVDSLDREQVSPSLAARLGTWPSGSASPVHGNWLGQLDVKETGRQLSRGLVKDDVDALVFWNSVSASPSQGATTHANPDELRRRQQLAQTTLPFRGGKIRFVPNSARLAPESEPALDVVLAELERDTGLQLMIKAFADARETDGVALSRRRAEEIVAWLTARGVNAGRLVAKACGSSRALWFGDTEEERAANRRADLVRNSESQDCTRPSSFSFR